MKTPREILLRHHQAASPKLDGIRAGVVGEIAPKTFSWRDMVLSLRWHLAGLSAAWMLVALLNTDHSPTVVAISPRDKIPPSRQPSSRQIWAAVRESRRLLLQYTDAPAAEPPALPGRRSEIEPNQIEV
jgi:hypothetical protein